MNSVEDLDVFKLTHQLGPSLFFDRILEHLNLEPLNRGLAAHPLNTLNPLNH